MSPQVWAAVVSAAAVSIGWFVTYILTSIANRATVRRAAALAHLEKQLEKLYGPLAFLVLEGKQNFQELLNALGRKYVFTRKNAISAEDLKLWLFWAENDLMPRNLQIKNLLSENTHLLYGSKMPDSYLDFLNHHNSWMIQHLRWQKEQVPYSWHSSTNWPVDFETDVLEAFAALQAEHARLLDNRTRAIGKRQG